MEKLHFKQLRRSRDSCSLLKNVSISVVIIKGRTMDVT